MSNPIISGQNLLDSIRINLGGLANAFTDDQLFYFVNLGVSEVWSVLRSLDLDYFTDSTQDAPTGVSQDDYFADLQTTVREYPLPTNCRELRFIEVLTAGFQDRVFTYRKFEDPVFQAARRDATMNGPTESSTLWEYYFTVFGNQMLLAQFPEVALQLKIWYVASIDDVTVETYPAILHPFSGKITDYATERAMKSAQNVELDQDWMLTWKDSIKTLALSAGGRVSTNAIFITDFEGESNGSGYC